MIVNYDDLPVVLVQPGDGSDVGWRTPILDWDVEIDGADRPRLQRPIVGRCGNINGLRPNEIIRLGGHQEMKLNDWCRLVAPLRPGRYRVRLSYRNDPELQWHDPGAHDVVAMAMVRSSTACDLVSNDVVLTVVK